MGDTDQLPASVRAAKATMRTFDRIGSSLGFGVFVWVILLVATAVWLDPSDSVIVGLVLALLVWVFGHAFVLGRRGEAYKEARRVWDEWARRRIEDELDAAQAVTEAPDDPRWTPVGRLLAGIRGRTADDLPTEVLDDVESRLRRLVADAAVIDEALELEADLDEGGERVVRLESGRDRIDGQIERLVGVLRDLHVELAVREAERTDDILQRLRAELELVEADDSAGHRRREPVRGRSGAASGKGRDEAD